MRPVILFCAVTSAIGSFGLFAEVSALTNSGPANATITPLIRIYSVAFRSLQMGYASAMAYTFCDRLCPDAAADALLWSGAGVERKMR